MSEYVQDPEKIALRDAGNLQADLAKWLESTHRAAETSHLLIEAANRAGQRGATNAADRHLVEAALIAAEVATEAAKVARWIAQRANGLPIISEKG